MPLASSAQSGKRVKEVDVMTGFKAQKRQDYGFGTNPRACRLLHFMKYSF